MCLAACINKPTNLAQSEEKHVVDTVMYIDPKTLEQVVILREAKYAILSSDTFHGAKKEAEYVIISDDTFRGAKADSIINGLF